MPLEKLGTNMVDKFRLEPNEVLVREGESSNCMYWLQNGKLAVSHKKEGQEVILGHITSGELVGELSYLDGARRSATVTAVEPSDLVLIPHETIDQVFKSQPKWLEILFKTLAERLRKANDRV